MNPRLIVILLTALSPGPQQQRDTAPMAPSPVVVAARPRPFAAVPVIWPVKGNINSGYGNRWDPFARHNQFHSGLDISGTMGQNIYAPADGKVSWVGKQGAYGNLIVVEHEGHVSTYYGHLSKFAVTVGDTVTRGQIIGYIGATGFATGPHLHYEIRVHGEPINPAKYVLDTVTDELEKDGE